MWQLPGVCQGSTDSPRSNWCQAMLGFSWGNFGGFSWGFPEIADMFLNHEYPRSWKSGGKGGTEKRAKCVGSWHCFWRWQPVVAFDLCVAFWKSVPWKSPRSTLSWNTNMHFIELYSRPTHATLMPIRHRFQMQRAAQLSHGCNSTKGAGTRARFQQNLVQWKSNAVGGLSQRLGMLLRTTVLKQAVVMFGHKDYTPIHYNILHYTESRIGWSLPWTTGFVFCMCMWNSLRWCWEICQTTILEKLGSSLDPKNGRTSECCGINWRPVIQLYHDFEAYPPVN